MAVSFIGGGNRSTRNKTTDLSLTNFITYCFIEYTCYIWEIIEASTCIEMFILSMCTNLMYLRNSITEYIANSSWHWGSYGSIWTGPSPKKYYMDRSFHIVFFFIYDFDPNKIIYEYHWCVYIYLYIILYVFIFPICLC
jgi:hypothetical protein